MTRNRATYVKNILIPCVLFSIVTGILSGGLIFLFRTAADFVSRWSSAAYRFVGENPQYVPFLLLCSGVLGLISWLFLKYIPDCRGGGIPTSIGLMRGVLNFRWLRSLIGVFGSSMITYLGAIPLGTEGPAVQIGTAVGRGTVRLLGRRHPAWDRYVMTGGASAGFAAATGAPLTGILFAFEEVHERFSPMLLMVSAMTTVSGAITARSLFALTGSSWEMFRFTSAFPLPATQFWVAVVVGLVCGLFAVLFTKGYGFFGELIQKCSKVPLIVKVLCVFLLVTAVGFFCDEALGSGHHVIETLFVGEGTLFSLLLLLLIRSLLLILANHVGITGGLFVPSLAFGALLGGLCGKLLTAAGLLSAEYYPVLILVGMCSFLSASSRTPLMAVCFALEALQGLNNLLPVILGAAFAYVIIEIFGIEGFVDSVVEKKVAQSQQGKEMITVEREFTVQPNAFVIGKEIRDVLWPPSCLVLSVDRNPSAARGRGEISAGDILHLHYRTCDPSSTARIIEALVGVQ
ncbi:MAG: chloride channel protein [Clostridia bacterium]|nr:chloride channel protein [Clostridia bacterium]